MAFSVKVLTPYGVDRIDNVTAFGPEEQDRDKLLLVGENNEDLAVYNEWVSAERIQDESA